MSELKQGLMLFHRDLKKAIISWNFISEGVITLEIKIVKKLLLLEHMHQQMTLMKPPRENSGKSLLKFWRQSQVIKKFS